MGSPFLEQLQYQLRSKLLNLHFKAQTGHIGGALSCLDILIALFFEVKKTSDIFLLSKGHAASALYVVLNQLGEISDHELNTYHQNSTRLPVHPPINQFSSVPFALGSLGHGLPIACGMAKANQNQRVFVLMSDGETNEGTTWESSHFAAKHKLSNLTIIIDHNQLQGFGTHQEVLGDTAHPSFWQNLGFAVSSCDGHNLNQLQQQLGATPADAPQVIIAHTIKGKGVTFMENQLEWHYRPMTPALYERALSDIKSNYCA